MRQFRTVQNHLSLARVNSLAAPSEPLGIPRRYGGGAGPRPGKHRALEATGEGTRVWRSYLAEKRQRLSRRRSHAAAAGVAAVRVAAAAARSTGRPRGCEGSCC